MNMELRLAMDLPQRQREVLELLASGMNTKTIARELKISDKGVEFHRSRLMNKTGIRNVAGLTKLALRLGLTTLEP